MHLCSLLHMIFIVAVAVCSPLPISARSQSLRSSSFTVALETLQKHLNYDFQNIGLLRRAMTHSSYSEENNKAFSILGESIIETTVSLRLLSKDVDISSKDLNDRIAEVSKVETSCSVDGMRLGLQNVVRVSSKTNSSTSSVVCGAFRAIFGAIALDTGKSDDAGDVFLVVHGGGGSALSMFIKDFSKRSKPMCRLLEKDVEFVFDAKCKESFDDFIQHLHYCPHPLTIISRNGEMEATKELGYDVFDNLAKGKFDDVVELLSNMEKKGLFDDVWLYNMVIIGLCELDCIKEVIRPLRFMVKCGATPKTSLILYFEND